jgi:hypothetical protein
MNRFTDLRKALRELAHEQREKQHPGFSPESCSKLAETLQSTVIDVASDLNVRPEALACVLLKKWQEIATPKENIVHEPIASERMSKKVAEKRAEKERLKKIAWAFSRAFKDLGLKP